MKKILSFLAVLAMVVMLTSCQSTPSSVSFPTSYEWEELSKLLPLVDNNISIDEAVKTVYDTEIVQRFYGDYGYGADLSLGSKNPSIVAIHKRFPVELIRWNPDKLYPFTHISAEESPVTTSISCGYFVYRINTGGRLFLFFSTDGSSFETGSTWFTGAIYSEKRLTQNDFATIRPGNTLEDVQAIDPAAQYADLKRTGYRTVHLLDESILTIHYEDQDGIYRVKEMEAFDMDDKHPRHPGYFPILEQDRF